MLASHLHHLALVSRSPSPASASSLAKLLQRRLVWCREYGLACSFSLDRAQERARILDADSERSDFIPEAVSASGLEGG
jgi:hypothetical protein